MSKRASAEPDYSGDDAWLMRGAGPPDARADVFYIHPTTTLRFGRSNASFAGNAFDAAPLRAQASAFSASCRIYAPRYRQATLRAQRLRDHDALNLAYGDVRRAFADYLEHAGGERPFFLASHSQGTTHAVRLMQEAIAGKPVEQRLVAAYLIGGFVPAERSAHTLPVCESADQTGCVISWRTLRAGARRGGLGEGTLSWWNGSYGVPGSRAAVCVNPLSWRADDAPMPAAANLGSLPIGRKDDPQPVAHVTGAACRDGVLYVDLPTPVPAGFNEPIGALTGNEHLLDYNLFWSNIRENVAHRLAAWIRSARTAPFDAP